MDETLREMVQFASLLITMIGAGVGYGKMKQKIKHLEEAQEKDAERYLLKEGFQPFADEVLRRLRRIEQKQDDQNGRSKT